MHEAVVSDEAAFVLRLVVARGTLEGVRSWRQAFAKSLSVVTICQMPKQHVSSSKVAFAQRTTFPIAFVRLVLLQNGRVVAVGFARPLVEDLDHHVVIEPVMPHEQL